MTVSAALLLLSMLGLQLRVLIDALLPALLRVHVCCPLHACVGAPAHATGCDGLIGNSQHTDSEFVATRAFGVINALFACLAALVSIVTVFKHMRVRKATRLLLIVAGRSE